MKTTALHTGAPAGAGEAATATKSRGQWAEIYRRLKKNRMAMIGLVILLFFALLALSADLLFDYDSVAVKTNIPDRLQGPSAEHWLGTDELGRDVLARLVHGTRISMSVGLIAVTFSLIVGGPLGAIAGYFGGRLGEGIMRLSDVFSALPPMMLALSIVTAFGQNVVNLMIAVGISTIPSYIRVIRAAVLTVKGEEFVEAARAIGAKDHHIILRHILPNCMAPIIVQATLRVASAILSISSLSFLGLGVKPPSPEWGLMLSAGRGHLRDSWHLTVFPGLAIMLAVLSLNLLGDGLRDALDPKLKR